ncbi:MAG TPA: GvpL/GvpF family gas vesicle protein [Solirubrobacteraceae bacterium]|nr:GvpL/GvpF family gas vesicle protein [Solirubrobacteraceae bacterium]
MTLMLYGIIPSDSLATALRGIGGRPLRAVSSEGLTAIVSEQPTAPAADEETLRAYAGTVEALGELGTVLPARFGTRLADERAVVGMLGERREALSAMAARVRDAVEMGVRMAAERREDAEAVDGSGPGHRYLRALLEERRRAEHLAGRIDDAVGGLARERRVRLTPRPGTLLLGAFLVDADAAAAFAQRIAGLGEPDLIVSGPWPPYSFVDALEAT